MALAGLIFVISFPVAVWAGVMVRRDESRLLHLYVYVLAGGAIAFAAGLMADYGLFALVFVPVGVLAALADSFFRIFDWFHP